jgi:hypothetical protein
MKHRKLFLYGTSALIFAMYWAMFASFTNWWGGLLIAAGLSALQYATQRAFKNAVVIEKASDEQD